MPFDAQPTLEGRLLTLRPLAASDFPELRAVASDALIWEQHPAKERAEPAGFRSFFDESLASGGALVVIDASTRRIVGVFQLRGSTQPQPKSTPRHLLTLASRCFVHGLRFRTLLLRQVTAFASDGRRNAEPQRGALNPPAMRSQHGEHGVDVGPRIRLEPR